MTEGRNRLLAAFVEHRQELLRFLQRRLGDHALAQDLTQETWLRVATVGASGAVLPDNRQIGNPRSYLYRIAANLAVDHLRHQRQGIEIPAEPDRLGTIADPSPSPEKVVLHRDELRGLLQAIDELSPRCREVFLLTKLHGLSYGETADRLGIAKNTVMVHMANVLAQLGAYRKAAAESGG